eukprot:63742-Chlamydomonas_euryale.AAC.1
MQTRCSLDPSHTCMPHTSLQQGYPPTSAPTPFPGRVRAGSCASVVHTSSPAKVGRPRPRPGAAVGR